MLGQANKVIIAQSKLVEALSDFITNASELNRKAIKDAAENVKNESQKLKELSE